MAEQLHTVQEAAERLKLHPKTVLRLMHEGRLRGTRIGKSYRIQGSDLKAFAGMAAEAGPTAPLQTRVTCVVEVDQVTKEQSERIAALLSAVITSDHARMHQVHTTTAYDPAAAKLKLVLFGTAPDAVGWLQLLQVQLDNFR